MSLSQQNITPHTSLITNSPPLTSGQVPDLTLTLQLISIFSTVPHFQDR